MNREQGLEELKRTRIVVIVRGLEPEHMTGLAEALYEGGIRVMEVTLNTPGALEAIGELQDKLGDRMYIGAGTVLDTEDAERALAVGASFLVTPNMEEDVIRLAAARGVPIFPGAMTPTEVVKAWRAGATAVKLFPSASLGLGYIKELQGPLGHIPMIAVGGVKEDNIRQFMDAGCYAVGIGGSLVRLDDIRSGRLHVITDKARRLLTAAHG
ncbi:2-dehydro-3-deoxyphosphogluconate aldolase [Gordoniibacillus kamchatkensis]|uniref:2-dehydro-3-deoxyphosphogluconate aldolase n=1 Tax=Gordoniibacillus kamchatkensis TaxID=1590651 RepID=A0ABR5ADH9_9BACL|nr:bifunctional 4-hydroxy-2-oxoglutarate aldolase/2-dehydro-3-deoxy-phosphogluconate aldolase [Paenibacillus sp. VKM B-2647]KIL39091.1 2-dehydro-3-deoxyphosphogluconate aldolase [Paenibacillus sp. VKM B-2647]